MALLIVIAALIFAFVIGIVAVAAHLLFSPWLLVAALAVVAWLTLRARRSRR